MTHQEIKQQDLIERYVRKQLPAAQAAALEEHFFACDDCFDEVQATERFVAGIRQAAGAGRLGSPVAPGSAPPPTLFGWLTPAFGVAAFAALALLIGLGWLALVQMPRLRGQVAQVQREKEQLEKEKRETQERLGRELENERLARAQLEKSLAVAATTPGQENPTRSAREQPNKDFSQIRSESAENSVSRTMVADPDASTYEVGASRDWDRARMGKPLSEVRLVHLQASDNDPSRQLSSLLGERLAAQSPLQSAELDRADADLRISARPANGKHVIVLAQLVNANGYVVWPATRRESSWRYMGRPEKIADRLLFDLRREISRKRTR